VLLIHYSNKFKSFLLQARTAPQKMIISATTNERSPGAQDDGIFCLVSLT